MRIRHLLIAALGLGCVLGAAAPASAEPWEYRHGRHEWREAREREHWRHERWEHERWEHRHRPYGYWEGAYVPAPGVYLGVPGIGIRIP